MLAEKHISLHPQYTIWQQLLHQGITNQTDKPSIRILSKFCNKGVGSGVRVAGTAAWAKKTIYTLGWDREMPVHGCASVPHFALASQSHPFPPETAKPRLNLDFIVTTACSDAAFACYGPQQDPAPPPPPPLGKKRSRAHHIARLSSPGMTAKSRNPLWRNSGPKRFFSKFKPFWNDISHSKMYGKFRWKWLDEHRDWDEVLRTKYTQHKQWKWNLQRWASDIAQMEASPTWTVESVRCFFFVPSECYGVVLPTDSSNFALFLPWLTNPKLEISSRMWT